MQCALGFPSSHLACGPGRGFMGGTGQFARSVSPRRTSVLRGCAGWFCTRRKSHNPTNDSTYRAIAHLEAPTSLLQPLQPARQLKADRSPKHRNNSSSRKRNHQDQPRHSHLQRGTLAAAFRQPPHLHHRPQDTWIFYSGDRGLMCKRLWYEWDALDRRWLNRWVLVGMF